LVRASSHTDEVRFAGAQLFTGDVTDRGSVERALGASQALTVFHVAGVVKALRRGEFNQVNAGGVEAVVAACADRPAPPVLIVVSSLSAAGPCAAGQVRVESDPPAPVSNYGRSKLAGEQAAANYAGTVPTSIVRPPIVFGPGDRAVLEMFRPIARRGLHVVPGWGKEARDRRFSLIYVDDLIEALLLTAEKGERLSAQGALGQGIYFIAGDPGQFQQRAWRVDHGRGLASQRCRDGLTELRVGRGVIAGDEVDALAQGALSAEAFAFFGREQEGFYEVIDVN